MSKNSKTYIIRSSFLAIQDAPTPTPGSMPSPESQAETTEVDTRRDFHIQSGDYFANLATIVGFAEEEIRQSGKSSTIDANVLKKVREDLVYVQRNYALQKKGFSC